MIWVGLGEDSTEFQPYYPEIFDRACSPLLARTIIKDEVLAPIIDMLSRQSMEASQSWIDYRNLSVFRLGNIYAQHFECNFENSVMATVSSKNPSEANVIAVKPANLTYRTHSICTTHSDFINFFLRRSLKYDVESEAN